MTRLLGVFVGALLGGAIGALVERVPVRPVVQSLVCLMAGWLGGALAAGIIWFVRTSDQAKTLALSVGIVEGAAGLAAILLVGVAVHVGIGWAGARLHPAVGAHRALLIGVAAAVLGALQFEVHRDPGSPPP